MEIFYLVTKFNGKETTENLKGLGGDEFKIKELRWFSQDDFKGITVYPEELKDDLAISYLR